MNFTDVAPEKSVPVMVTLVPIGPDAGVNDVMVGTAATVKLVALVAVPPGVVTAIAPVVAPVGTVARMDVADATVKVDVAVPLNVTAVAPVKLAPVMDTLVPMGPEAGANEVIVGVCETVKLVALVAVPPGV